MQLGAACNLKIITKVAFVDATPNGKWLIQNWTEKIVKKNKIVCLKAYKSVLLLCKKQSIYICFRLIFLRS